jgi:hypothetical protein
MVGYHERQGARLSAHRRRRHRCSGALPRSWTATTITSRRPYAAPMSPSHAVKSWRRRDIDFDADRREFIGPSASTPQALLELSNGEVGVATAGYRTRRLRHSCTGAGSRQALSHRARWTCSSHATRTASAGDRHQPQAALQRGSSHGRLNRRPPLAPAPAPHAQTAHCAMAAPRASAVVSVVTATGAVVASSPRRCHDSVTCRRRMPASWRPFATAPGHQRSLPRKQGVIHLARHRMRLSKAVACGGLILAGAAGPMPARSMRSYRHAEGKMVLSRRHSTPG